MARISILILITTLFSCNDYKTNLTGVWYGSDSTQVDRHYFEAHVIDTSFVVVDDVSISYMSTFQVRNDTLELVIRDVINEYKILDTLEFIMDISNDTLKLTNANNSEKKSTWIRLKETEPFNFFTPGSLGSFPTEFKKRYRTNYLEVYLPEHIDENLKDFDTYWMEK